jgi:hypothetical protein
MEHIRELNAMRKLPFKAKQIGRVWSKGFEIDVGATDGTTILLGECKWSLSPVGADVLGNLEKKITANTELSSYKKHLLYLFSRSGFTEALRKEAQRKGVVLVELKDMFVR